VAQPLTPAERQAIIDDLNDGKSVNQTAKDHGRAPSTVSRIGKQAGIDSLSKAHSRLARAHAARRAYGAEARAERLAELDRLQRRIMERIVEPASVFSWHEGMFVSQTFAEPTSDAVRQFAAAIASLSRAEMEVVKYDERGEGDGADVDRWLDHIRGDTPPEVSE
jgi:transposase-like protein